MEYFPWSHIEKKICTTYGKDITDTALLHGALHVTAGRISENTLADGGHLISRKRHAL
jgi:hypothetical protein